jgi:DNA-binding NarL/FixJ family response regulator
LPTARAERNVSDSARVTFPRDTSALPCTLADIALSLPSYLANEWAEEGQMSAAESSPALRSPGDAVHSDAVRVFILADVRLYREGLARALDQQHGLSVVGTASVCDEALAQLATIPTDIVLLDVAMTNAVATARSLLASTPSLKVVAFAVGDRDDDVLAVAEAGLAGYVPRDASLEDLALAILSAARGEVHCSPRTAATLFRRLATLAVGHSTGSYTPLTARELEIARLVGRGLSNKEIAAQLSIEVATVKNHVHNVLEKLKLRRRAEVTARVHAGSFVVDHRPDRL